MKIKKYDNGDSYFGEFFNGHKEGLGVFYKPSSMVYIGQFKNGNTDGKGVTISKRHRIFYDKDSKLCVEKMHNRPFEFFVYKEINPNQFYGFMKFQKMVYKGFFDSNVKFEEECVKTGTLIKETTHYVQKGVFQKHGLEGVGEYLSNSEQYLGYFKNGLKNGIGFTKKIHSRHQIITHYNDNEPTDSSIEFIGHDIAIKFFGDQKIQGFIHYKNGDLYLGDLREISDEPDDDISENEDVFFIKTVFKKLIKHGFGTYYTSDNDYYTGGWELDHKSGIGFEKRFESANKNGDQLEKNQYYGMFANNKKNGFGKLEMSTGQTFEGIFLNNNLNGTVRVGSGTGDGQVFKYCQYHESNLIGSSDKKSILEYEKTEAKNLVFDKESFLAYSLKKQTDLEVKIQKRKKQLIYEFVKMTPILKANYELFKQIEQETNQHFFLKSKILKEIENMRLTLFQKCNDSFFSIVLKDPRQGLKMFARTLTDDSIPDQTLQRNFLSTEKSDEFDPFQNEGGKDSFVKGFMNLIDQKPKTGTQMMTTREIRKVQNKKKDSVERNTEDKSGPRFSNQFPTYFNKLLKRTMKPTSFVTSGIRHDDSKNKSAIENNQGFLAGLTHPLKSRKSSQSKELSHVHIESSRNNFNGDEMTNRAEREKELKSNTDDFQRKEMSGRNNRNSITSRGPSLVKTTSARPRLNQEDVIQGLRKQILENKNSKERDEGSKNMPDAKIQNNEHPRLFSIEPDHQRFTLLSEDEMEKGKLTPIFKSKAKGNMEAEIDEFQKSLEMRFLDD